MPRGLQQLSPFLQTLTFIKIIERLLLVRLSQHFFFRNGLRGGCSVY